MCAKYAIISIIITSIFAALICSCGEQSVVGTGQSKNSGTQPQCLTEVKTDLSTWNEIIYCIAINETGDILWFETYDSINELGFSLPEQQVKMWETYDVAVIDACDLVTDTDHASTIDNMIADADMIILVAGDLPINWSCLKSCQGASDYASCVLACMGKRPKSSGF